MKSGSYEYQISVQNHWMTHHYSRTQILRFWVAFLHTDRAFQLSLPSGALLGLLCDPPIGGSIGGGLRRLCLLAGISVDDLKCRVLGYYHVLVQYITEGRPLV